MRILILGGTKFLGRHIVEAALATGHQITLFHRGQTGADLFAGQVERILGDWTEHVRGLAGKNWDAVVYTGGYVPRVVQETARFIKDEGIANAFLFISSISVYDKPSAGADESWPVATLENTAIEEITGDTYGPLKAMCEDTVREVFPQTSIIARPGLIVGPHDPTDRFTYWPCRMAEGGDVLVPGRKSQPVQIIDVRDLAAWCVGALEQGCAGTYNLTGPAEPYQLGPLLETIRDTTKAKAELQWVDPAKLAEWEVQPWIQLPLYLGLESGDDGMMAVSIQRAVESGLRLRPIEETTRDTLAWAHSRPQPHEWRAGLTKEREQELLSLWWS
ncbi:MAG: NAD-dependent epimerase/dehydratase family protein [Armatimonadetes bacterium]|nr:NAD-dependent epimerase/dehydratase family protein [Armatimonadota bacterium]